MELINSQPLREVCLSDLASEINNISNANNISDATLLPQSTDFPEEIFKHLPDFLKNACQVFENHIDKQVFLVSVIGAISRCLPNANTLNLLDFDISVSTLIENTSTDEQRKDGYDLADYFTMIDPGGQSILNTKQLNK